jgi:hypothetical protein
VDGSAVHAVMVGGSVIAHDSGAGAYHRVDGEPVHPTSGAATDTRRRSLEREAGGIDECIDELNDRSPFKTIPPAG